LKNSKTKSPALFRKSASYVKPPSKLSISGYSQDEELEEEDKVYFEK
jgi:hypothetical protein